MREREREREQESEGEEDEDTQSGYMYTNIIMLIETFLLVCF
jgi:hypothetical protein